jgi:hypothetical protein
MPRQSRILAASVGARMAARIFIAAGVTSAGPRAGFSAGTIADLQAAAGPSTP